MPRPKRCRKVCTEPDYILFSPDGIPNNEEISITYDEFEAVRLVDLMQCTHNEAAERMEVARTTLTEIYNSARNKIADAIVNGKSLSVSGGNYRICGGGSEICGDDCRKLRCSKKMKNISMKGTDVMRIAVTYENGQIFQHFGHTEQFIVYDVENGEIVNQQILFTMGSGHGALAGFLKMNMVDVLICGGIGGGAQTALAEAGIKLFGGVSGSADDAVKAYLAGNLGYNPDVKCSHHDHEHSEGHSCGSHGCGSHNCGNH